MSGKYSCNHIEAISDLPFHLVGEGTICHDCECSGPNLWMCLQKDCMHIGCSENFNDHSTIHFKKETDHCVHVNLSTRRIWCYICESEVFLRSRSIVYENSENEEEKTERPRLASASLNRHVGLNVQMSGGDSDENNSSETDDLSELASAASAGGESGHSVNERPRGLVGLQNIGNTCYMNSALQALSNTPPLTSYFLDCGAALQMASENKKPGLSRTYQRLVKEIWNKKTRGYVVPSGILYGIRNVYPMFRGYHQHDTQEFLRCFMDQLHEELKEPCSVNALLSEEISSSQHEQQQHQQDMWRDSPSPSQSEGEYETCDSGVSERSSLSDDTERPQTKFNTSNKRRLSPDSYASSPTPRCKLTTVQYSNVIDTQPSNSQGIEGPIINKQLQKTPMKYRSVISDLFDGKLLSSVQCLTCDRISTRIETFQDLSLPIPGRDHITMLHQSGSKGTVSVVLNPTGASKPVGVSEGSVPGGLVTCADSASREGWWSLGWLWGWLRSWFYGPAVSLHDCLAAFFSADELKGDNMYSCEKCNKLRNGVKFSKVIELPEVLCIHLKRFRHELMFSSKISNQVAFPMKGLDMRPYLHRDCISGVSEYDLSSVICHHGTAGGGHYTCYALNQQRGSWFEFDDQYVTQMSPETVECCEAYVLFYRKCSRNITTIRQRVVELTEMQGAGDMRFYVSRQWYTRFMTCAEPGPIDNSDFLCAHSAVRPHKMPTIDKLSIVLSQPVWEYLQATFGGGPTCNHLYECPICGRLAELHLRRIRYELETFIQLNQEFQQVSTSVSWDETTVSIYAISMKWLRCWQAFVRNQTEEPPGPIDNTTIVMTGTVNIVKLGSDYAQISEELWVFLYRIYGGGPPIQLRCGLKDNSPALSSSPTPAIEASSSLSPDENTTILEDESTPLVSTTFGTTSTSFSSSDGDEEDDDDGGVDNSTTAMNHANNSEIFGTSVRGSSPPKHDHVATFTNPHNVRLSNGMPGAVRPPKVYVFNNSKARRRRMGGGSTHDTDPGQKFVHAKYGKYNGKKQQSVKAGWRAAQKRSPSTESTKEVTSSVSVPLHGNGEVVDQ